MSIIITSEAAHSYRSQLSALNHLGFCLAFAYDVNHGTLLMLLMILILIMINNNHF